MNGIIPAPPPAVSQRTTQAAGDVAEMRGLVKTRQRPSTVPEDVWTIVEEYRDKGGLFDLSVQIARLEAEYRSIDALVANSDLLPAEALRLRLQLTEKISTCQARAVDVAVKTRGMITDDGLRLIMSALIDSLRVHVRDPHLIHLIGQDVGAALRALKSQVKT